MPNDTENGSLFDEFETRAHQQLEATLYDYVAGGAEDERTLADNIAAWDRLRLRPRVLRDVSKVSTATTFLGTPVAHPIGIAPMAMQHAMHADGALGTARGAAAAQAPFVMSLFGAGSAADVAALPRAAPRWLQVYVMRDKERSLRAAERTLALGYDALVLTVDVVRQGHRMRDQRNAFSFEREEDGVAENPEELFNRSLTFDDVTWWKQRVDAPLVIKGVLRGDDARACAEAGADAVIVSNHGGRQLDTAIAAGDALVDVVSAVGERAEVYVDGGIRRGHHIVKALALGARGVFVGRPVMWGLVAGGSEGVRAVLREFHTEFERAMALCGAREVSELDPSLVVARP